MMTVTHIATGTGDIYLKKLCHYFARQVPATYSGTKARIEFPFAPCYIDIDQRQMKISIETDNPDALTEAENRLTEQLARLTQQDASTIRWVRSEPS